MKISLELIARELACTDEVADIWNTSANLSEMCIFSYALLDSTPFFTKGFIYVSESNNPNTERLLPALQEAGAALLCIGQMPESVENSAVPAISCRVPAGNGMNTICRLLGSIFDRYEKWHQGIYSVVKDGDIQKLLDMSYSIFHATLYFFANNVMKITAIAGSDRRYYFDGRVLPFEMMNLHYNEPFSKASMGFTEAFIFPKGFMHVDVLCYNLFTDTEFSARVFCLDESPERKYLASDFTLMNILGSVLQMTYDASTDSVYNSSSEAVQLHMDLLNNEHVDKSRIDSILGRRGWTNSDIVVIYLCVNRFERILDRNRSYYCRILSERYDGIIPVIYDDNIIIIFHETHDNAFDSFLGQFIEFVKDGNLQFGVSNKCSKIEMLHFLYMQAKIAFSRGTAENPRGRYYYFDDFALTYIIQNGISQFPPELICAPELTRLLEYDSQNGANYAATLKEYLSCGMNAVSTAKKMYIHHATMVYRLKRIQEIGGIDFDNQERLTYINISYLILGSPPSKK